MPKFLVFSDIHRNLDAVRELRTRESNSFDAVLVAGDIGTEVTSEFLSITRSFECPVLFVYGNWDNRTEYSEAMFASGLIHQSVHAIDGYFVTGFSGCPTHWGLNPKFLELQAEIRQQHGVTLDEYRAIVEEHDQAKKELELLDAEAVGRKIDRLNARTKSKRTAVYREAARRIHSTATTSLDRKLSALDIPLQEYRRSIAYRNYLADKKAMKALVLEQNRSCLDRLRSEIDPRRTILMTHERLYRLQADAPLLHVFGHRHTYAHSKFHDTHLVNVAALDNHDDWISDEMIIEDQALISRLSGYCIIEVQGFDVIVHRKTLRSVSNLIGFNTTAAED